MIPVVHIETNITSSFIFIAFFNMINDGSDNVVTPIINASTVPNIAPFVRSASAIGIVANMSAYIGIPSIVARTTPSGFF